MNTISTRLRGQVDYHAFLSSPLSWLISVVYVNTRFNCALKACSVKLANEIDLEPAPELKIKNSAIALMAFLHFSEKSYSFYFIG